MQKKALATNVPLDPKRQLDLWESVLEGELVEVYLVSFKVMTDRHVRNTARYAVSHLLCSFIHRTFMAGSVIDHDINAVSQCLYYFCDLGVNFYRFQA